MLHRISFGMQTSNVMINFKIIVITFHVIVHLVSLIHVQTGIVGCRNPTEKWSSSNLHSRKQGVILMFLCKYVPLFSSGY